MRELTVKETAQRLLECESAYIIIHRRPDGDCTGSGFALMYALRSMGRKARVLCSDEIPEKFHFLMPEVETLEEFHPEMIISADIADEQLFGENLTEYEGRVDLCIDHHISNTGYAKELCLDGNAAAACQVAYEVIREMGIPFTREIAMCLYTGIATDTGCFMHDNAKARTFEIVSEIMKMHPDIPYADINRRMFTIKSMGRLRLEGLLAEQIESYADGRLTVITITKELMEKYGIAESDFEGLAGFPLQVEGAEVGAVIKERDGGECRVSLRSAGNMNVSLICQAFGGGGHKRAAGCSIHAAPLAAKQLIVSAVLKGFEQA